MSSNNGGPTPHDTLPSATKVVAMFVCPGAKDVPLEHAVFPHGFGCSQMTPCPGRDICMWYATHDLGGEMAFNELPEHVLLPASFEVRPFSCPNFRDLACRRRRKLRRSKKSVQARAPRTAISAAASPA